MVSGPILLCFLQFCLLVSFCSWVDPGAGSLLALLGSVDGACCSLWALPDDELLRTDDANKGLKVLLRYYLGFLLLFIYDLAAVKK